MSTKLKLLGVDVASFGDARAPRRTASTCRQRRGPADLRQAGPLRRCHHAARRHPGRRRVGVRRAAADGGRAAARRSTRDHHAERIGFRRSATRCVGALPAAVICSCNMSSRGDPTDAIAGGCADVAALKGCTVGGHVVWVVRPRCSTAARSRGRAAVEGVVRALRSVACRAFEIVTASGIRTFSGLIARYGTGPGCDICKPVVASILAVHQFRPHPRRRPGLAAGLQRPLPGQHPANGSYSVVPRVPGGDITAGAVDPDRRDRQGLRSLHQDHRRAAHRHVRCDGRSAARHLARLVDGGMESGQAYGKSLRTVKSCVGSDWCRYGQQDSVQMAIDLDCATAVCVRRTRSRWASPAARGSVRRRGARTWASSRRRPVGISTSAVTAA